jgi:hypothetical protein
MHPSCSVVAIILSLTLATARTARADWIADPRTGCRVWNLNPQEQEKISWSGPCKGGLAHGQGVLQWFLKDHRGDRYEGELRDGRQNGYGILVKPNGDRFEGVWLDGKANGPGRIVRSKYNYDALWIDGCAQDGNTWIGIGRTASTCR